MDVTTIQYLPDVEQTNGDAFLESIILVDPMPILYIRKNTICIARVTIMIV